MLKIAHSMMATLSTCPSFHSFRLTHTIMPESVSEQRGLGHPKRIKITHYNGIQEFFKSNDEIDVMQRVMQEETLIEMAAKVSRELEEGDGNKADARILLSAPLIKSHSGKILGGGRGSERLVRRQQD